MSCYDKECPSNGGSSFPCSACLDEGHGKLKCRGECSTSPTGTWHHPACPNRVEATNHGSEVRGHQNGFPPPAAGAAAIAVHIATPIPNVVHRALEEAQAVREGERARHS